MASGRVPSVDPREECQGPLHVDRDGQIENRTFFYTTE